MYIPQNESLGENQTCQYLTEYRTLIYTDYSIGLVYTNDDIES